MAAITTAGKVTCKQGAEAVTVREFGKERLDSLLLVVGASHFVYTNFSLPHGALYTAPEIMVLPCALPVILFARL